MPTKTSAIIVAFPDPPILIDGSFFNESRMKVFRARHHVAEVSYYWHLVVENNGDGVRLHYDANGGTTYLNTEVVQHGVVSLALSDCIRCLRSALDYLISSLARSVQLPDNQTIFPFNSGKLGIEASFEKQKEGSGPKKGRKAGALFAVSQHYPLLKSIILDQIKPYCLDDGSEPFGDFLWRLITMDNIDKHRLITPTIQVTKLDDVMIGNARFTGCTMIGRNSVQFGRGEAPYEVNGTPEVTLDIMFPETTRLPYKSVLSSLVHGCNIVAETIDIFETAFPNRATN
jgi:hypothetical protein